ncbi:hypothetical protein HMH01_05395 [Halovulum dunhuangense]|uniref:Peptidase C45 hydrolase domain-containing protein n=1 Tax=Halovulum dunhuangense TaxID=1505036 RepID=A0A849L0T7_9RHOB|nr:C45 family peptidase [Halovulum dunhuangense]NNU79873.1 hypothetical protein [Halovulum dunhuangense]
MTGFAPRPAEPLVLRGDAFARGLGQAADRAVDPALVRAATLGRVAAARAEGVFDAQATAYVAAQRLFHDTHDQEGMAELAGIAQGFGLRVEDLFDHLHLGTLRDLKSGARLESDGCSAWAVSGGPDGPLVVKNRDYSGLHTGIQRVVLHEGTGIAGGRMLCLGSLGSPGAYSSGMNAAGLALADTQVAVRHHRVGWLRYFLMTRLLSRCLTVAEALAFLRGVPHAGGGTLLLADATGAVAAVELGASGPVVETAMPAFRTNHYVTPALAQDTLLPQGDRIAGNSHARRDLLARRLPGRDWDIASAAALMRTHATDAPDAAPLCQHGESEDSQTLSSAIYSCRLASLTYSEGNPCAGDWRRIALPG